MKEKSRTSKAIINVVANLAYQISNTIVNLILPPLIISKYGSVINGLISTIKQIVGYVQLVGAGIAESTVVALYKPLADNDKKTISGIFNASAKAFWQSGVIFSVISALLAVIYPFLISDDLNYFFIAIIVLIVCVSGASEFFVVGKCRTLLTADQKIYVVNIAQIAGAILNAVVTIILIKLDMNIVLVQAASTTVYVMRIIILVWYVKKHYPYLDKKVQPIMDAVSKRHAATVHQLAGLITFGSQTIFVSSFCGLAEGSVYAVYSLVFTGINTLLSTVSSALLAGFGDIIAKGDRKLLNYSYNIYECLYFMVVFIFYSVAYILILPFVSLYTGNATDVQYIRPLIAILFCLMGMLNCLRTPGATLINASGHYAETKNRSLIEMTICFVGEVLLVGAFKIEGVLIATIIAYLYRTVDVLIYSNKIILQRSPKRTFIHIFVNIVTFILLQAIFNFIPLQIGSWLGWIVNAIIVTTIATIGYIIITYVISKEELLEMKDRILSIIFRR